MDRNDISARFSLRDKYETELFRLLDRIETSIEKNIFKNTNFVDPYIASICNDVLENNYSHVKYIITGGYKDAERKVIIIYPDYYHKSHDLLPLKVLKIEDFPRGKEFNHREVLGTILGLGLKREKIGDIIISGDMLQIIVLEEVASYIELNLTQIGRFKVKAYIDEIHNIIPRENEFKLITDTVKSLRLDSVSSVGFNESRNRTVEDIRKEKVKVNFIPILTPSYNVKEGDLISYRGKGRILLEKVLGKTKKDRYKILIKKFI